MQLIYYCLKKSIFVHEFVLFLINPFCISFNFYATSCFINAARSNFQFKNTVILAFFQLHSESRSFSPATLRTSLDLTMHIVYWRKICSEFTFHACFGGRQNLFEIGAMNRHPENREYFLVSSGHLCPFQLVSPLLHIKNGSTLSEDLKLLETCRRYGQTGRYRDLFSIGFIEHPNNIWVNFSVL